MPTKPIFIAAALLALLPSDSHAYVRDYFFADNPYKDMSPYPIHVEGFFRKSATAKFFSPEEVKGTTIRFTEANTNAYYSHHITKHQTLSLQGAYHFFDLHWKENPRFKENEYNLARLSLAYINSEMTDWRWVINGGGWVDANTWNVGKSGVGYGALWGRYSPHIAVGIHTGLFGWYGVKNGYLLPIIGFDTYLSRKLKLNLIFPTDVSLRYMFNYNWFAALCCSYFGEFYKLPIRAHKGVGEFKDAIFTPKATGMDLNLIYNYKCFFTVLIGGGYHFGGALNIRDSHNKKAKYFKFRDAPYGQIRILGTF